MRRRLAQRLDLEAGEGVGDVGVAAASGSRTAVGAGLVGLDELEQAVSRRAVGVEPGARP